MSKIEDWTVIDGGGKGERKETNMTADICQVCGDDGPDMRHVGVECFYSVQELVPDAEEQIFFVEIPDDGTYLGYKRKYPAGVRERFKTDRTSTNERDVETIHMKTVEAPIPAIRLQEISVYSIRCCKSCRAGFLGVFKRWREGEFREGEGEGNIPVRINGTTRMLTEEEYREFSKERRLT